MTRQHAWEHAFVARKDAACMEHWVVWRACREIEVVVTTFVDSIQFL
jgi:hypothetical protein